MLSYRSSTDLNVLFCLYSSAAARDLHSFPTRRSSDLFGIDVRADGCEAALSKRKSQRRRAAAWCVENRSEEHTSELQSPDHLVCRLLLEKKKQKPQKRPQIHRIIHTKTYRTSYPYTPT